MSQQLPFKADLCTNVKPQALPTASAAEDDALALAGRSADASCHGAHEGVGTQAALEPVSMSTHGARA